MKTENVFYWKKKKSKMYGLIWELIYMYKSTLKMNAMHLVLINLILLSLFRLSKMTKVIKSNKLKLNLNESLQPRQWKKKTKQK